MITSLGIILPIGGNKSISQVLRCIKSIEAVEVPEIYNLKVSISFTDYIDNALRLYSDVLSYINLSKVNFNVTFNEGLEGQYNSAMWGRYSALQNLDTDIVTWVDCDDEIFPNFLKVILDSHNKNDVDFIEYSYIEFPSLRVKKPIGFELNDRYSTSFKKGRPRVFSTNSIKRSKYIESLNLLKSISNEFLKLSFSEDFVEQLSDFTVISSYHSVFSILYKYNSEEGICCNRSASVVKKKMNDIKLAGDIISELIDDTHKNMFIKFYEEWVSSQ